MEYVHDQSGEYTTAMGDGSDNEVGKAEEEEEDHTPEESDPTDTDFNIQEELRVTTKSSTKEVQVEHIPVPLEDKGDRPYSCNLCGNRFKEVYIFFYTVSLLYCTHLWIIRTPKVGCKCW